MSVQKEEKNVIGIKLQEKRKEKGFSQEQLAKETGITRSTIAKYEKGLRSISAENLKLISEVLGIDETSFLKNEELNEVVKNLIQYQQVNGITKKEMAELTGIDSSTLTKIITGKRKPSTTIIKKINHLFSDSSENMAQKITIEEGVNTFPKVDKEKMGARIYKIRKNRDESLAKFGKQLTTVSGKNVVTRWEKGINIPDIEKLMNIAYLGKTTVPYLLYGSVYENMIKKRRRKKLKFVKLDPVYLGRRLRKIRCDYRLEREDFGKFFDSPIRKWSMDRYENGKDIPNTERLVQYAFLGKVHLEFLIYGVR